MPVRSFECVIERGRLRDADHGFARGAGEQMRFGETDHAWRRNSAPAHRSIRPARPGMCMRATPAPASPAYSNSSATASQYTRPTGD